jgi:hypothetical protein
MRFFGRALQNLGQMRDQLQYLSRAVHLNETALIVHAVNNVKAGFVY